MRYFLVFYSISEWSNILQKSVQIGCSHCIESEGFLNGLELLKKLQQLQKTKDIIINSILEISAQDYKDWSRIASIGKRE